MLGLSARPNRKDGLRKVFEWPKIIETASFKHEPHRITYYLYELATLFHSYWSKGNEDQNYNFVEQDSDYIEEDNNVLKYILTQNKYVLEFQRLPSFLD